MVIISVVRSRWTDNAADNDVVNKWNHSHTVKEGKRNIENEEEKEDDYDNAAAAVDIDAADNDDAFIGGDAYDDKEENIKIYINKMGYLK